MNQTMGSWNARLWIHLSRGRPVDGNVPTFEGSLDIAEATINPIGRIRIAGVDFRLEDGKVSISGGTEAIALSCTGMPLRDLVQIPACGSPDIDRNADAAVITRARCKKDVLEISYIDRRISWNTIVGEYRK
jgi:hypothetical protein